MPEMNTQPSPDNYLVSANGRLGSAPQSEVTEVSRILDLAISKAPANGLVIHFHGGLDERKYALENIVEPLTKRYEQAQAYPLFFVWESGFKEALTNNWRDILKDPAFQELVKKVSEWVLKKVAPEGVSFKGAGGQEIKEIDAFRDEYDDWFKGKRDMPPIENAPLAGPTGMKAAAGLPNLELLASEIEGQLLDDKNFRDVMAEAYNAANPPGVDVSTKGTGTTKRAEVVLISPNALDEMFPPETGAPVSGQLKTRGFFTWATVAVYVAKLVISVIKRFRNDRDHGVYCTIVEEVLRSAYADLLGATIWNAMKNDTIDSFNEGENTCGFLVVQKLKALEKAGQSFKKITLIGHSTGAIYICNFLDAAKAHGLATPIQVVFLAPAVTYQRFAQALDAHGTTTLQDFRMFAMCDAREKNDAMLKPLYTRSLLYFVSGLLEGVIDDKGKWSGTPDMPLVGMERFLTVAASQDDKKVQQVRDFLNAFSTRTVWSPALGNSAGLNSDSRHHGDFDNDDATLVSLIEFISC